MDVGEMKAGGLYYVGCRGPPYFLSSQSTEEHTQTIFCLVGVWLLYQLPPDPNKRLACSFQDIPISQINPESHGSYQIKNLIEAGSRVTSLDVADKFHARTGNISEVFLSHFFLFSFFLDGGANVFR